MRYFDVLDHYELLVLDTEEFPPRRPLPPDYSYAEEVPVEDERRLLEPVFPGWRNPVERRLPGWRDDSRVAVVHEGATVAVCYVSAGNQLGLEGYGELHYAAVDDAHRGQGLWGAMITELFARSAAWGVRGVVFVTDRKGPIEMYHRLGARPIGTRPKGVPAAPPRSRLRRAAGRVRRALSR